MTVPNPQIYMSPIKELRFFAFYGEDLGFLGERPVLKPDPKEVSLNFDTYCSLFDAVSDEKAIGEASPLYLFSSRACENINRQCGREPIADFSRAVQDELSGVRDKWLPPWRYVARGFYYKQLKGYFDPE